MNALILMNIIMCITMWYEEDTEQNFTNVEYGNSKRYFLVNYVQNW